MTIYRKIYEEHYGPIPKDEEGRTYEIHHIDGNHKNNHPSNLKAVSIKEHYKIHYKQRNYSACIRIISRMNMSPKEISQMASEINIKRAKEGLHPSQKQSFKDKMRIIKKKEIEEGNHPFCNRENLAKWASKGSRERVKNRTHHLLDGKIQKDSMKNLIKEGKHNFQKEIECVYCGRIGRCGPMKRHVINCSKGKQ